MAKAASKLPVRTGKDQAEPSPSVWRPLDYLRKEIDRLFEDFNLGSWRASTRRSLFDLEPMWRREFEWGAIPAVDIVEKNKAYDITVELPGLDEKDIEVRYADGMLTIRGEKKEEKEEKKKDFFLAERRYGSFERSFRVPAGVDVDRIDAKFKKGVLTLTLPKKPEAQRPGKKIDVKGG